MSGQWLQVFFEPLDVLLFRDHRPFDAGLQFRARTRLPFPTTFVGCLRTALFRLLGADFSLRGKGDYFGVTEDWARPFLGGAHEPPKFEFHGPLLARRSARGASSAAGPLELFFPPPADLRAPRGNPSRILRLDFEAPPSGGENAGEIGRYRWNGVAMEPVNPTRKSPWLHQETSAKTELLDGFLTYRGAEWWRTGGDTAGWQTDFLKSRRELFQVEERTGIARDDTLTVMEGMFYVAQMLRFAEGTGFAGAIKTETHEQTQLVKRLNGRVAPLGGKNRRAKISVLEGSAELLPREWFIPPHGNQTHRVWLLTPAMGTVDAAALSAGYRCLGAVTERAIAAGGFDYAHGAPKPLWPIVGAGSILHVVNDGSPSTKPPTHINDPSPPPGLDRYGEPGQLGYGWAVWQSTKGGTR
ncbi:MAG: type III-B CRISPR module-associated protein Cmr3 [Myxococcales bacterium]|nr:type III-B CRISPR module-associated protein Cmr3 [Myxococcales bacterium]